MSIGADGKARMSIPVWTTYRAGLAFAKKKSKWLKDQVPEQSLLFDGQVIGRSYVIKFSSDNSIDKIKAKVGKDIITVKFPEGFSVASSEVQAKARQAGIKALRLQAEEALPRCLQQLASFHGFDYRSVTIKKLRSRWGSCDSKGNIVLNLFLMQLPQELIEYVVLHELTHTEHLHHGEDFWRTMNRLLPDVKDRRRLLRQQQPKL